MNNVAVDPKILEATDWLLRLTDERANGREVEAWRTWLTASPENRSAFERAQEVWDLAPRIENAPWPTDREVQTDNAGMPRRRRVLALAASLAVVTIGAGIALWQMQQTARLKVLTTSVGENHRFTLEDGSIVTLGGASRLKLDFSAQRRGLDLQAGEAFFQVRRDPIRPFTVRAGGAEITAVGTAFNVRRAQERVQVAVTEGVVTLAALDTGPLQWMSSRPAAAQGEARLAAGHQVVFQDGALSSSVPTEVPVVLARHDGRLQYTSEPLRYVVADLNRYSPMPIELDGEHTGDLLVTGTVLQADLKGWLQGLEKALPVVVRIEGQKIRIDGQYDERSK